MSTGQAWLVQRFAQNNFIHKPIQVHMGACVGLLMLIIHAGMWYHLSLFLDAGELGVAYTGITTATALSQVIGGPLAAALLLLDGTLGLHGWQWLFICEGIPTIIFAVVLKVG